MALEVGIPEPKLQNWLKYKRRKTAEKKGLSKFKVITQRLTFRGENRSNRWKRSSYLNSSSANQQCRRKNTVKCTFRSNSVHQSSVATRNRSKIGSQIKGKRPNRLILPSKASQCRNANSKRLLKWLTRVCLRYSRPVTLWKTCLLCLRILESITTMLTLLYRLTTLL